MRNVTFRSSRWTTAVTGLVLLTCLAAIQGCANYQVRTPDSDPVNKTYEGDSMHAIAWGHWMNPEVLTADCGDEAINDVVVRRNYLQDLASVLTLGIWMPTVIEYRCRAPHSDISEFPGARP